MNNPTKQADPKNQKGAPAAQPGKNAQQEAKAATMPLKPSAQTPGTRPGQPGKPGPKTGNDATSNTAGRDNQSRGSKPNQNTGDEPGKKKARVEGGTDDDDRDETGQPTGMADTRVTNSMAGDEDDEDAPDRSVDEDSVRTADRAKNANGGSNKPR